MYIKISPCNMPKQEQGRSRGIAPHTLTLDVRRVWVDCAMPQQHCPPPPKERNLVPI
jgi:hypothetical protein